MIAAALLAAAAAADQPICADRPSKADGTCTVPRGYAQIETGLIDWTRDTSGSVRSDLLLWGSSFVKYGIGPASDVEIGFTPVETLRVGAAGEHGSVSGFGDVVLRWKQGVTIEGAPVQTAVIPFVKLPTASRHFGNGKVEGGVTTPLSAALGKSGMTLTLGPELDFEADTDGHGHHLAMAQVVNLGFAATARLSVSAELWAAWDWGRAGTTRQASADGSAAYLVTNDLQLDAGANFGLDGQTPDLELYAGISKRF